MPYGQISQVKPHIYDHNIGLLGESGIGKTTLMAQVCRKYLGIDGYMILDCGKEDALGALGGYNYEVIEDYKKFDDVTKDIIKNKDVYYKNMKVIVIDTIDQLFEITAKKVIADWNREHQSERNFKKAKTLNGVEGGFQNGDDLVVNMILDRIWELRKVGVSTWINGHTKTKEEVDPISGQTFVKLTSNMTQRNFGAFKKKFQIIGIAYKDRNIETQETGRTNIVTKKKVTVNKIVDEKRKIVFRDNNYSIDSKSRFSEIAEEIPFDPDEFVKAIQSAIDSEVAKMSGTAPEKKPEPAPAPVEEDEDDILGLDDGYPENLLAEIQKMFKASTDKDLKAEIRNTVNSYGSTFKAVPEDELKNIYDMLK